MRLNRFRPFVIMLLFVLCGCGSGQPVGEIVATVPAAGVLLYQGKPLAFHQVTVMPTDNRPAVGVSDEQGKFVLGTNKPDDGAPAGKHAFSVHYVGPPSNNPDEGMNTFTMPPPPAVKIPASYADSKTSGLVVEIASGGNRELKLELK